jgi:lipid-binding SYLF domain-containing protein
MKISIIILSLLLVGTVSPVRAQGTKEWDDRVLSLAAKFETLQQHPDKCIPAEVLRKAQGIILLDRTRAGLGIGYQGGNGVAMARDPQTREWSAAAFLKAHEASLGFQIGAEQNFFVILLMNTNASRLLTDPNFEFGSEARGTAGDASAGAASTVSDLERPVLVYSSREGLYGGAALKAGAVAPDEKSNQNYYGQFVTMKEILYDHKVQPTPAGTYLAAKISAYAHPPPANASR